LEFQKYIVPIRNYFYFRFTSAILFFLRSSLSIGVRHASFGLGAPENIGIAVRISQICCC